MTLPSTPRRVGALARRDRLRSGRARAPERVSSGLLRSASSSRRPSRLHVQFLCDTKSGFCMGKPNFVWVAFPLVTFPPHGADLQFRNRVVYLRKVSPHIKRRFAVFKCVRWFVW